MNQPVIKGGTETPLGWNILAKKYCPRCVLRHTTDVYIENVIVDNEETINEYLASRHQFDFPLHSFGKDNADAVCAACLGLLQDVYLKGYVNEIISEINNSSYDFPSFQLLYSLPVQLMALDAIATHDFSSYSKEIDDDIKDVKQVMKLLLDPMVSEKLSRPRITDGLLEISIIFNHVQTASKMFPFIVSTVPLSVKERKEHERKRMKHNNGSANDASITQSRMKKFLTFLDSDTIEKITCPLISCCEMKVSLFHLPVFVGGRYNKYSRTLPQSPWLVEGERKVENSVQEYLADPVKRHFKADKYNFSSSGREDVDVKMLGDGRPFIVELINPRCSTISTDDLQSLQNEINESTPDVTSNLLQIVHKEQCKRLNEGATTKTKSYSALCCFRGAPSDQVQVKLKALNEIKDLTIMQRTPVRVLHRRPLATRPRTIHSISAIALDSNPLLFKLSLSTQAGTYVKEFVHGDFGRTLPNLSTLLGTEVDIIALDVEAVNINWP